MIDALNNLWSFTNVASLASILGLILTSMAYLRIGSLRKAVSLQSVRRTVHNLFEEIQTIPDAKQVLTQTQERNTRELLKYVDMFFISKWKLKHSTARQLRDKLRNEINNGKSVASVKRDAGMLRDQLFWIQE
jgi:hypothetical protein